MRNSLLMVSVVSCLLSSKVDALQGHDPSKLIEVTAATPQRSASSGRALSLAEKRYEANAHAVGSDENVAQTVAYFERIVNDAKARIERDADSQETDEAGQHGPSPAIDNIIELQREVREMREYLQVLVLSKAVLVNK